MISLIDIMQYRRKLEWKFLVAALLSINLCCCHHRYSTKNIPENVVLRRNNQHTNKLFIANYRVSLSWLQADCSSFEIGQSVVEILLFLSPWFALDASWQNMKIGNIQNIRKTATIGPLSMLRVLWLPITRERKVSFWILVYGWNRSKKIRTPMIILPKTDPYLKNAFSEFHRILEQNILWLSTVIYNGRNVYPVYIVRVLLLNENRNWTIWFFDDNKNNYETSVQW